VPIVTAVDVRGHLNCNFKRALVLGGAQLLLIAHYVGGSVVRGEPCFGIRSVYEFYWTGAVLKACYIAGTYVLAAPWYSLAFWWQVLWWAWRADEKSPWTLVLADEAIRAGTTTTHTRTAGSPPSSPYTWTYDVHAKDPRLVVRFVMSLLVNQTGLIYIMSGLPLQLAWSESREDFVLNAIAVFFIFQLDDLAVPVEYSVVPKDEGSVPAAPARDEENKPSSTVASNTGLCSDALRV
jgi:hypothetical protein